MLNYRIRDEGNLSYYYSKFCVFDFTKKWDRYEGMSWLSFLEALGRIVGYKTLPRLADLEKYGISPEGGLPEFSDRISDEGKEWDAWMQENSTESGDEDPFHERLDQLIAYIFHVLESRKAVKKGAEVAAQAQGTSEDAPPHKTETTKGGKEGGGKNKKAKKKK